MMRMMLQPKHEVGFNLALQSRYSRRRKPEVGPGSWASQKSRSIRLSGGFVRIHRTCLQLKGRS
jgi:hypothetical protein